jgi:Fe-S cluster assembly protein SufD
VKCARLDLGRDRRDGAVLPALARGAAERAAQSLLVLAFLAEAIAEIEDEALAEDIRQRLENWLTRHEG